MQKGDEKFLSKWWNDGDMMSHASLQYGLLKSEEAILKDIEKDIYSNDMFPEKKRFILCKKSDMTPIGEINWCLWNKRAQNSQFGIKICETSEQGKGYGVDALSHFIDFMFRFLNLHKIELTSMGDNKRAHSLYKKLGFKEIGIIRESCFDSRTGTFSDVMYMDLLKKEWEEIREKFL